MQRALSLFGSYTELKNANNKTPLMTMLDLLALELKALKTIKCSYCNSNACMYIRCNPHVNVDREIRQAIHHSRSNNRTNDHNYQTIRKKKYSCIHHQIRLSLDVTE